MAIETWKPIPEWPFYEASTQGRIRSLQKGKVPHIIKPCSNKYGRHVVTLKNGLKRVRHCRLWSRVIMETFSGPSKLHVNHINGIKTDNRLCNLEYTTHKENAAHAVKLGLYAVGERVPSAKLNSKQVVAIFNSPEKNFILAKTYNVTPTTIWDIKNRRTWAHITECL